MDMYWSMIIFSWLLAPRGLPLFIFPWLVWASVSDSLPYTRICFSIIQIVVGWFVDFTLNWTLDYEVSLIRRPGHQHNIYSHILIHEEKYEHNDLLWFLKCKNWPFISSLLLKDVKISNSTLFNVPKKKLGIFTTGLSPSKLMPLLPIALLSLDSTAL